MHLRSVLLCTALFAWAPSIFAQADEASAADIESARASFRQGLELRDEQHDYPAAIEKLKAAYALVPTPRIAYELGKTYRMSGDLLNARAMFLEVDRLPVRGRESEEAKKARADSRVQAAELESKIPSLTIRIIGEGEAQLTLDDQPVSRETLAAPRKLNPGQHRLGLQLPNRPPVTRTVELREGEQKDIEIKLPAPSAPPSSQDLQTTSYYKTTTRSDALHGTLLWTMGAGVSVGTITGVTAIIFGATGANSCDPVCSDSALEAKNTAMTLAWIANVSFIASAASFIAYIAIPPLEVTHRIGIAPTPGGAFIGAQGRF